MSDQRSGRSLWPDCTVRYDELSGCGVNVLRQRTTNRVFVELTFVTLKCSSEAYDLTLAQVEQLRAALDAVTRTDPPTYQIQRDDGIRRDDATRRDDERQATVA